MVTLVKFLLGAHDKYRFTGTEKIVEIEKWITHPDARDFKNDRPYGGWYINSSVHYDFSLLLSRRVAGSILARYYFVPIIPHLFSV